MRCDGCNCHTMYGPNFFVQESRKINTASPGDISDLDMKAGFAVGYFKYRSALDFRAYGVRACPHSPGCLWVCLRSFLVWATVSQPHGNTLMHWLVSNEVSPVHLHKQIIIGNELCAEALQAYGEYTCMPTSSSPQRRTSQDLRSCVGDHHAKAVDAAAIRHIQMLQRFKLYSISNIGHRLQNHQIWSTRFWTMISYRWHHLFVADLAHPFFNRGWL